MASLIARYVAKRFPVASMVYVREDGHWSQEGMHLSKEAEGEYMEGLRGKLAKFMVPKGLDV
ncbi:hypothetical protein DPMN_045192 [Dreissena polymorpha]|uniref:Uncharacterized protein n=1 Tax=Dreissena polymorpha TaxID=45954 RepID=A0A9D4D5J0_DREPO|nr:hypothetical protein DPMN_045192 [Dreissena polymorpha]